MSKMMKPKISLLLITFNKLSYLRGTLLALQSLNYPREDFEVVVINDGSSDGTAAFLDVFEPNYALRCVSQANAGRSRARNSSMDAAQGELLVFLDDDFLMHPDSLRHLWQAYQAEPSRMLISTLNHIAVAHVPELLDTLVRDGQPPWNVLDDLMPVGDEYALADLRRRMLTTGIDRFAVPWVAAQGMSVAMPAHLCRNLQGYDPRFTAYGMEDFDLAYRFFEQGGRFQWVDGSRLYHLDHGHQRAVLFKESTVTTRAFYEKFQDRPEIKQFIKFLCGALSFRDLNNAVAQAKGIEPIDGFNLRFSPYGMIRYRDRQLGQDAPSQPALRYTKAQDFRLRFLLERIGRDLEAAVAVPEASLPEFEPTAGKSVLVIAPHMDDEVIGCGGLIHRYSQAGSVVTVLFLSDGAVRNLPQDQYAKLCSARRTESERAADVLGVERCIYLGIPERNLAAASADPTPIQRVLDDCRPDVIVVPGEFEHHPDHRVAYHWLRAALDSSSHDAELLCYEVWGSCMPTHVLPLDGKTWERKVKALDEYQTQLHMLDYQGLMRYVNETRGKSLQRLTGPTRAEGYRRIAFAQKGAQ